MWNYPFDLNFSMKLEWILLKNKKIIRNYNVKKETHDLIKFLPFSNHLLKPLPAAVTGIPENK